MALLVHLNMVNADCKYKDDDNEDEARAWEKRSTNDSNWWRHSGSFHCCFLIFGHSFTIQLIGEIQLNAESLSALSSYRGLLDRFSKMAPYCHFQFWPTGCKLPDCKTKCYKNSFAPNLILTDHSNYALFLLLIAHFISMSFLPAMFLRTRILSVVFCFYRMFCPVFSLSFPLFSVVHCHFYYFQGNRVLLIECKIGSNENLAVGINMVTLPELHLTDTGYSKGPLLDTST